MDWFNLSIDEKKEFLTDKRLSIPEKTILDCSIQLRQDNFPYIIETLSKLSVNNKFVNSQRLLVLGVAYNVSGNCDLAVSALRESVKILEDEALLKYQFISLVQLFFALFNLKKQEEMLDVIEQMNDIKSSDLMEKISYYRCKFNYLQFVEDYPKAKTYQNELKKLYPQMQQGQKVFFLIDQFTFFIKTDQYIKCEIILNELKKFRTYKTSTNFTYMKVLLSHFLYKKPIYIDSQDFEMTPLLKFQINLIMALENGNLSNAKEYWLKLNQLNHKIYADFLNYRGDKCLFSICLSLYKKEKEIDVKKYLRVLSDSEQRLIKVLARSSLPVSKEILYFEIYGVKYVDKSDLKKLSTMFSRIRRKTDLKIKTIKGSYCLEQNDNVKDVA